MEHVKFALELLKTFGLVNFSIIVALAKLIIPKRFIMKSVSNKIVLITGAGSGIGAALAVKFAKLNARLVLWDINEKGLNTTDELCKEFISEKNISIFLIDITDRSEVMRLAEKIKTEIGHVDLLINNAGVVSGQSILELDETSILRTFNVNVFSHFWTVQAFLPAMLARNSGHIVSMASLAGLFGANKLTDYCASKFAAVGLQEALLNEIRYADKSGIDILTVCPFFIDTGMFNGVVSDFPLLPILKQDYVVDKIEEAILTRAHTLYLPRLSYFVTPLKHMLPVPGYLYIADLVGSNRSMENFYGRH